MNTLGGSTGMAADRAFSWTAPASAAYILRVLVLQGTGQLTVSATATATALATAPPLYTDGAARLLTVACLFLSCSFVYDGAQAFDGDGATFDLRLEAAQGTGYAIAATLQPDAPAVALELTFFYSAATGGADSFESVGRWLLGDWTPTPVGHHSMPTYLGCANEDWNCWGHTIGAPTSFGIHPGGSFPRRRVATWASTVAGPVLLRVALSCDVPFYADVEVQGCTLTADGQMNCRGSKAGRCRSTVSLAVTANAYFSDEMAAQAVQMFAGQPPSTTKVKFTGLTQNSQVDPAV
jgi:hypothetical protein